MSPAETEQRAASGDPDTLYAVAMWRLLGTEGPRDLAAAHAMLRKAAAGGHVEAARCRANLIAGGTGVRADPDEAKRLMAKLAARDPYANAQLDMLRRFPVGPSGTTRDVVNVAPDIILIGRLLAPEECRYIMTLAEPRLEPSMVVDVATGQRVPHPVRTSDGTSFGPIQEDLVINRINRRIAAATGTRYEAGEPLHILRYAPAQQYRPHVDTLPGVANQRIWTALVYLNQGYGGGETDFPELGITIGGVAGDALIFRNVDEAGRPDPRTRHAGLPVTSGTKWLATRWIRAARYHPWEEEARPAR